MLGWLMHPRNAFVPAVFLKIPSWGGRRPGWVAGTKELPENLYIDLDEKDNLVSMAIEHTQFQDERN